MNNYNLKIGDEINIKYKDGGVIQFYKTKVFNISDIYFTTTNGHAIYYKDIIFCNVQNKIKFQ